MPDEVVVDKALLKAIGAESRINILKSLTKRRKTQSELAQELGLSPPTVLEHLNQLVDAGLIEKFEEGRKWKYYALTKKGKGLVSPSGAPVHAVLLLAVGLLFVFSSVFMMNDALYLSETPMTVAAQHEQGAEIGEKTLSRAVDSEEFSDLVLTESELEEPVGAVESVPAPEPVKLDENKTEPISGTILPDISIYIALFAIGIVLTGIGAIYYVLSVFFK